DNAHCSECTTVEENSTYNAETHHLLAARYSKQYTFFQLVPAIITAVSGALSLANILPTVFTLITALSAVATAVGTVLNPLEKYYSHLKPVRSYTALKHDARALREVWGKNQSDQEVSYQVKAIHDRYNELVRSTPITDKDAFKEAQERIKAGVHTSDAAK